MSSALTYLEGKKLKNQLLNLVKKPANLIYLLILGGALAVTIVGGNSAVGEGPFRDIRELVAILFVLLLFISYTSVSAGFKSGGAFFSLQDVNLVFVAPIKQIRILMYGLLGQAKMSILLGFFLLFQYTVVHVQYGISYFALVLLVLVYGVNFFVSNVLCLLIYCACSSNEKKKKTLKTVFYAVMLVFAAVIIYFMVTNIELGFVGAGVLAVSTVGKFLPITGWLCYAYHGMVTANALQILLGLGSCALLLVGLIVALVKVQPDYYEDVLKTAETNFQKMANAKAGNADTAPEKVKIGKTGISNGEGASVFYYKHLIEARRARVFILGTYDLVFLVCTAIFCLFMGKTADGGFVGVIAMSVYCQLFSVSMGSFGKELAKPWIYLIPEKPFSIILSCIKQSLRSSVVEAVLYSAIVGTILKVTVLEYVSLFVLRFALAYMFIVINILTQRVLSGITSKAINLTFLMVVTVIMIAPGVALGILLHLPRYLFLLAMAGVSAVLSTIVLYCCRNMVKSIDANF